MSDALGTQVFIAFARQTSALRTPAVSGFSFLPSKAGGLALERPSKPSDQLYGGEDRHMRAQNQQVSGSLPFDVYINSLGVLLDATMFRVTTEVASYTVTTGVNDKIDFDIGGGAVAATVAAGTYTTTTLATAVQTALNSAAAGTYTLAYSSATKKFTLSKSTGTFTLPWATGTNAATSIKTLLGFTANDTGSLSYLADSQAAAVLDHVFTWPEDGAWGVNQEKGMTVYDHRGLFTNQGTGMLLSGLTMAWSENDPHAPMFTPTFVGADLERIVAVEPSMPAEVPMSPDGNVSLDIVLNGNTHTGHYFQMFSSAITFPVAMKHTVGDTVPVKAIRTGKVKTQVQYTWPETDDTTLSEDHDEVWQDNDATASVTITQNGETIRGSIKSRLKVEMPALRPTGSTSQGVAGTIDKPYAYAGQWDSVNDAPGLKITVRSTEVIA